MKNLADLADMCPTMLVHGGAGVALFWPEPAPPDDKLTNLVNYWIHINTLSRFIILSSFKFQWPKLLYLYFPNEESLISKLSSQSWTSEKNICFLPIAKKILLWTAVHSLAPDTRINPVKILIGKNSVVNRAWKVVFLFCSLLELTDSVILSEIKISATEPCKHSLI